MHILADFHHAALYRSLQLLFENGLGWKLYRPIGMDWYHKGYWSIHPHVHINIVKQFLETGLSPSEARDPHGDILPEVARVNEGAVETETDGIYTIPDKVFGRTHRGVTLERFKKMDFDLIIASVPQHVRIFDKLTRDYQPKAKNILQMGNNWVATDYAVKNIMASIKPMSVDAKLNVVFYHQPLDLKTFHFARPNLRTTLNSYIHYMRSPELLDKTLGHLPGWSSRKFGAGMDHWLYTAKGVAQAMEDSAFTWHYKPEGDGFGHNLYASYAMGRPVVAWQQQYAGMLGEELLEDGVNCILADGLSPTEIAQRLRECSVPEVHNKMCEAASQRFSEVCLQTDENERIRKFLENLR